MTKQRLWARWVGESVIIVASVFVAIFLEGVADDSARSTDAHASLAQLMSELRADRDDLVEVRQHQAHLGRTYDDLLRWMVEPGSLPTDSVQLALNEVAFLNRTMYPRRGAWRALTSSGQLAWVSDRNLVTRLANFYESMNVRLEAGGRDYDFNVNEVARVTVPQAWDAGRQRPHADLVELREQLRYLRLSWNRYYVDLLDDYGEELDALLRDLGSYLADGDT